MRPQHVYLRKAEGFRVKGVGRGEGRGLEATRRGVKGYYVEGVGGNAEAASEEGREKGTPAGLL